MPGDRSLSNSREQHRVEFANTLRGLAALCVILAHYFGVFWLSQPTAAALVNAPAPEGTWTGAPNWILLLNKAYPFNWGAFGVAIFFLISGFVIPFSLGKATAAGFCISRMFRILPTYVIGLTITLAAVWGCSCYFARPWPFRWHEVAIHYFPGIRDLVGSRNIDGVVWTLEIEVKFYLLCACLLPLFRARIPWVFVAPVVLSIATMGLCAALPLFARGNPAINRLAHAVIHASPFIVYMFIGVVFNYMHAGKIRPDRAHLLMALIFTLFCLQWQAGPYRSNFYVAWNYGFGFLAFAFAYSYQSFFRDNPVFGFLANISYPLYVIHGVAGYAALRILLEMGAKPWLALGIVTAAALGVAWLVHTLVEKPTQEWGKALARWHDGPAGAIPGMPAEQQPPSKAA